MSKIKIFLPFLSLVTLISISGHSMTFDRSYIENFAKQYVEKHVTAPPNGKMEVIVSAIDPRVQIKPCESPLQANIPENHNRRNVNIKISCVDSKPWYIYLPAKIINTIPVVVAKENISKGSLLDDANLEIAYHEQNKIRGEWQDNTDNLIGGRAKRSISKGTLITKRNICIVCKGDSVTIVARSDSLSIKTSGIALKDGNIGDQIRVKNKRSGKTISARISAINQVTIDL